ncbi:glycosyltransferase family 2 protein [Kluyvera sp. CHPC 1.251]|uniref:glycosyltransferase family 2 protein n=1 Tax=Kluyvera sp. CHPC 1.251 TaxID=2995175 RepID=UPI002FD7A822
MEARIVDSTQLTICIPTYNRFEKLKKQVKDLLQQLDEVEKIVIIDNATPLVSWDPDDELFNDPRITLIINSANVGLSANLVKSMDIAQQGWLWVLSDDEQIMPDALMTIREYIQHDAVDFINFKCEMAQGYKSDNLCKGINDYFQAINNDFGNHLLISNNILKVSAFKKYIKFAYWGCFTNAPHIAPVLMALDQGSTILLSSKSIVSWTAPEKNQSWRMISHFSVMYLADILSTTEARTEMLKVLMRSMPKLEVLTAQLSYNILNNPKDKKRIIDYATRIFTVYSKYGTCSLRIRARVLQLLINFPVIYFGTLNFVCVVLKKKKLSEYMQKKNFEFYL